MEDPDDWVRGTRDELIAQLRRRAIGSEYRLDYLHAAIRLLTDDWCHAVRVHGLLYVVTADDTPATLDTPPGNGSGRS